LSRPGSTVGRAQPGTVDISRSHLRPSGRQRLVTATGGELAAGATASLATALRQDEAAGRSSLSIEGNLFTRLKSGQHPRGSEEGPTPGRDGASRVEGRRQPLAKPRPAAVPRRPWQPAGTRRNTSVRNEVDHIPGAHHANKTGGRTHLSDTENAPSWPPIALKGPICRPTGVT